LFCPWAICQCIVKLWPEIKTSEDKCIARLKITASTFGLAYLKILADCHLLEDPDNNLAKNVDFFLHLHYDTPSFHLW
jgi:hypothetical protein